MQLVEKQLGGKWYQRTVIKSNLQYRIWNYSRWNYIDPTVEIRKLFSD